MNKAKAKLLETIVWGNPKKANPKLKVENKKVFADEVSFDRAETEKIEAENMVAMRIPDQLSWYGPNSKIMWLLDDPAEVKKIVAGERGLSFFDPPRMSMSARSPIESIFLKGKDSKNVVAAVVYQIKPDSLVIHMMAVKKGFRRNKVNSFMIDVIKKEHPGLEVVFDSPTPDGKKFITGYETKNPLKASNPRSPESFLSFYETLIKLGVRSKASALEYIENFIAAFSRQDIVEAALHLHRSYDAYEAVSSNLRQKFNTDELDKLEKIVSKSWPKISNIEQPELDVGYRPSRQRYDYLYSTLFAHLNHFRDMLRIPSYKQLFLNSEISFANQPLIEALAKAEKLEEKLPDTKYEEAILKASPTKLYLDLGNGLAWFHIDAPSCRFEAEMADHCGAEAGSTLFSLRKKNDKGQWIPHVTASWVSFDGKTGYLVQIKGRSNSKPKPEYHPAIVQLLLSPAVQSIKESSYKPHLDFKFKELPTEVQKKILAVKPYIDDFDKYILTLDLSQVFPHYQEIFKGKTYDLKLEKDFIQFIQADDLHELVKKLYEGLNGEIWKSLKSKVEYIDEYHGDHVRKTEVPVEEILLLLEKEHPKTFKKLAEKIESSEDYDSDLDLSDNLKSGVTEEVLDLMWNATTDAYSAGYQNALEEDLLSTLDEYQLYRMDGEEGATIVVNRDGTKPLIQVGLKRLQALKGAYDTDPYGDALVSPNSFMYDAKSDWRRRDYFVSHREIYADTSTEDILYYFMERLPEIGLE